MSFTLVWGGGRGSPTWTVVLQQLQVQTTGTVSGDVARTRLVSFTLGWGGGRGSPGSSHQTARDKGSAAVAGTSCWYCLRRCGQN